MLEKNEIVLFNNKRAIEDYIYQELDTKLIDKPEFKNLSIREIEKLMLEFEGNHLCCAELFYLRLGLDKFVGFTYFEKIQFPIIFKNHNNYFYEFYDDDSIYFLYKDFPYDENTKRCYDSDSDFIDFINSDFDFETMMVDDIKGLVGFEKECFNYWNMKRKVHAN